MGPRLFSFELAWADAAFDAIFPPPPKAALEHGIAPMYPAQFLDDVVRTAPFEQSLGLRLTLWVVALAPIFALRRFATIASLDVDDRPRVIERLLASPIYAVRQLVMGFKAIGALLYAQSPVVRAQMVAPAASVVTLRLKRSDPPPAVKQAKPGDTHEHAAE